MQVTELRYVWCQVNTANLNSSSLIQNTWTNTTKGADQYYPQPSSQQSPETECMWRNEEPAGILNTKSKSRRTSTQTELCIHTLTVLHANGRKPVTSLKPASNPVRESFWAARSVACTATPLHVCSCLCCASACVASSSPFACVTQHSAVHGYSRRKRGSWWREIKSSVCVCVCVREGELPYAFSWLFSSSSFTASLLSAGRRCHGNAGRLTPGLGSGDVSTVVLVMWQPDGGFSADLCTAAEGGGQGVESREGSDEGWEREGGKGIY